MKKYTQLILLIISIVSLGLFLIYRHEYNRLHYVLEVFNFFGQPCNITNLQQTENILSHHDWGPVPTWQEHESGYIYSGFLTRQNEAKALTIVSDEKLVPRNCYFWLEDKKRAVIGKFRYSKIVNDDNSHLTLYFYICTLSATQNNVPYAVSFASGRARKDSELKKIMLTNSFNHRINMNTTICVSPSIYSKRRLIEFLSYHKLIGIDSFIFYNRDVPHRLAKIITNLSTRLGLQVTFYAWNYPKSETALTRVVVENDCLLRTFGQTHFAIALEMNEYIVPTSSYSFNTMTKSLDAKSQRFGIPVQKFCISGAAEPSKPISTNNLLVQEDNSNVVRYLHRNGQKKEDVATVSVGHGDLSIHKYLKCSIVLDKVYNDQTILRYSTDLVRSTLFQLFMHNQI